MVKRYNYECKCRDGYVFKINSDDLHYVAKKREKELFDETGAVYDRYYGATETINKSPAHYWFYAIRR